MPQRIKKINIANSLVIFVTFILFALALVTKDFTHDLLLEAAVFLVSVKLILGTYQITILSKKIDERLDRIENKMKKD